MELAMELLKIHGAHPIIAKAANAQIQDCHAAFFSPILSVIPANGISSSTEAKPLIAVANMDFEFSAPRYF